MYSKVKELIEIIKRMYNHNGLIEELNQEIIQYCKILTQQNYFQYKDLQYFQEEDLNMGAPESSIF